MADASTEKPGEPMQVEESLPTVDKETEKRLLKKLDRRIIPMAVWIYLMNMMDRGMVTSINIAHEGRNILFGIETD